MKVHGTFVDVSVMKVHGTFVDVPAAWRQPAGKGPRQRAHLRCET